jgi:DNA-binding XRE family transcriptional regulator
MNAAQLKKVLKAANLSQRAAAKEIDINERTMRKYVSGELAIPRTVELALCYVATLRKIS